MEVILLVRMTLLLCRGEESVRYGTSYREVGTGATARLVNIVSYNQNLWIDHPFGGAAYLPR
ncbi:MAG TPA: hypothetical protein VM347_26530 [Nonomuraea sp.]|nr:hypothetical protein [Nonomuraea sp.]